MCKLARSAMAMVMGFFLLVIYAVPVSVGADSKQGDIRTWTVLVEKKVKAEFVRLENDTVILRTLSGKEIKGRMDRLAEKDRKLVKRLSRQKGQKGGEVPKKLKRMLGHELVNKREKNVRTKNLGGKKVAFYFSAHWCPPCRQFTPKLVEAYNEWQDKGKNIEIVFISRDKSEDKMEEYMEEAEMPWLAVPYEGDTRDEISSEMGVQGIPKLIVFNTDGEVITRNARGYVAKFGSEAIEKWSESQ